MHSNDLAAKTEAKLLKVYRQLGFPVGACRGPRVERVNRGALIGLPALTTVIDWAAALSTVGVHRQQLPLLTFRNHLWARVAH